MKIFKYILILLITFLFVTNVYAVTITTGVTHGTVDPDSLLVTNTGTISVTGVGADVFDSYKIIDAFYNSTTNTITYEFTTLFKNFLASTNGQTPDYHSLTMAQYEALVGSSTSSGTIPTTSTTLDALMSGFAQYIKTNNPAGSSMTTSGGNAQATLAAGSYLILTGQDMYGNIYSVMVGNVSLVPGSNNTWNIEGTTINAKKSSPSITKYFYDYRDVVCSGNNVSPDDGVIIPSQFDMGTGNSGGGDIITYRFTPNSKTLAYNKYERNSLLAYTDSWGSTSGNNFANCQYNASYNIGEEYDYIITATVPTYPPDAINKVFTITDNINYEITFKGLNYVTIKDGNTTLTIQNGNVKNGNTVVGTITYTAADPNNGDTVAELEIDLDPTLITSNTVTIQYTASLDNNASIGIGNSNEVNLRYSFDPYGSGTTLIEDFTYAYTYAIGVWKYDSEFDDAESPLADYPEPDCEYESTSACNALWDAWAADIAEIADITVVSRPSCELGSSQACDNQWDDYHYYTEEIFAYYQTHNRPDPGPYMLNGATFAIYEGSSCTGTPLGTFTTQNQSYPNYVFLPNSGGGGFDPGNMFYKFDSNKSLAYNNEKYNSKNTLAYLDSSGGDGIGIYYGIKAGTYCIKEIVAPTGYRLDPTPHVINVGQGQNNSIALSNEKIGLLPETGGIGTYIYIGVGAVLVVASSIFLVLFMKKNKEKDDEE